MKKIFSLFSLVVIGFSMMLFSACDVSYEDISLAPSQTSIELAVGEEKTFDIEIKNYNSEISNVLSINNPDNIISIEETEVNKGKTFVTIKGLRVGETILDVRSLERRSPRRRGGRTSASATAKRRSGARPASA